MSIFKLAYLQLKREGKLDADNFMELFWDRAIKIRKFLDYSERNTKIARKRELRRKKLASRT